MTVNRTTLLDLPLPVTGTESGTWGDTTNNGLTQYMDIAIAGMSNLTSANFTAGALTIETTEGTSSATNITATSAQYAGFRVTSLATNSTITVGNTGTSPARSYRLINADSTYTLTFKATGQTGVTLQPGQSATVAFNGTDYVFVGVVLGAAQTFTAAQTFRASNAMRSEAASTQDAVVVAGRAGGSSSYAATITPTTLSANRTLTIPDASGTILQSGTTVTVAQGGTGAATLTANNVILGNGTSAVQFVAPGTTGNVLTSNGTTWTSTAPTSTSTLTISNKTGAYTVVSGDAGTVINCTSGTFTVSLTAAASLGSGFNCWVWNNGTGTITIDPNGAETIDGVATLTLRQGEGTQIVCNGTNWLTGDKKTMRGYAENITSTSTRPVATGGGSIAIGSTTTSSQEGSIAIGGNTTQGSGATASGTAAIAIGARAGGATATGNHAIAIGAASSADPTASAANSLAIGSNSGSTGSQAVTGAGATALGGSYASGSDSFAAAVANNTSSYGATGTNSVAIGKLAKATGTQGLALGANATSTANGAVAISSNNSGDTTTASGLYSIAIGSSFVLASGAGSVALSHGRAAEDGKYAFGWAYFSNANAAECQTGTMVLKAATTSTTPVVFSSNASGAGGNNQVILPDNSAFAFSALIVARRQASGGTQSAAWKIEGLIRREGSAATTTLVNSATTVLDNTPGWTIAVSADTTNGGLAITATGAASTNIRWVATVQTSEVTYA